ncbi:MAG TPA: type II toxin-antitoxin system RelE/ParE family toxin [Bdellovibrionota bacterium]|nr:type II toxin-antitoxin system RelE/ParE family toxin [Bdellovibrionota bacterium]
MKVKYYLTPSGRSPVEDFLAGMPRDIQLDFLDAISKLTRGYLLSMPLSRNLSNIVSGLHELRFKDRAGQIRFFYYIKRGEAIYMIHAMRKKTEQIPGKDKDLILKRLREV